MLLSNCCGASGIGDFCSECKDHTSFYDDETGEDTDETPDPGEAIDAAEYRCEDR